VNVHPSKLEVRFEDEKSIYNFVLAVIRKSLGTHDLVPSMSFTGSTSEGEKMHFNPFNKVERNDFSDRPVFTSDQQYSKTNFSNKDIDLIFSALPDELSEIRTSRDVPAPFDNEEKKELMHTPSLLNLRPNSEEETTFIVQLQNKYILSQIKSGLMIIDQHVAHERILYEKALERLEVNLPFSQQLLFPRTVEFDPGRFALLKELNPYLVKLGFTLKFFSKQTAIIEGVPDDVKNGSEEKILREILEEYASNQREKNLM